MGKKKNKKKSANVPTTNLFWSSMVSQQYRPPQLGVLLVPVPKIKPRMASTNNVTVLRFKKNAFQAPHQQMEAVKELSDDNSPNNPMQPTASTSGTGNSNQSATEQPQEANVPVVEQSNDKNTTQEITLTTVDKSKQPENQNEESTQNQGQSQTSDNSQKVVEGFASDIKFVVQNKVNTVQANAQANTSNSNAGKTVVKPVNVPIGKQIQSRITRVTPNVDPKPVKQKIKPQIQPQIQPQIPPQFRQDPPIEPQIQPPFRRDLHMEHNMLGIGSAPVFSYPKGIPKTFLMGSSSEIPEPYTQLMNQFANQTQNQPATNAPEPPQILNWTLNSANQEPVWELNTPKELQTQNPQETVTPLSVQTDFTAVPQAYSPSDVYDDAEQDPHEDLESPSEYSGQKRLSAFDRLGPLSEPKKPKLTINLLFNKEQAVREVVDGTKEAPEKVKYVPVHLRKDITTSTDETVMKYLVYWPWKKNVQLRKAVTARNSKTVMLLELEQMEEIYEREHAFIQVSVRGYPPTWSKEKVLDALLEILKGKCFIPCFIEFSPQECKFLVIKCKQALVALHNTGFFIRKDDVELAITISQTDLSLNQIEFIPRLILRKRLSMAFDGEGSLDLTEFTTKEDISHFIYFPLNRTTNQADLIHMQSSVPWEHLTSLNLSRNRITSLEGFNLAESMPKLKHLDLSYNYLEKATLLLRHRDLSLKSIKLEGNPLCNDYIDPMHYVKVLKTMFSSLKEIDGVPIQIKGEMPEFKRNYCPEDAKELVEKFLEVYFPLLDSSDGNREAIENLYHEKACLTITYRFKLRYGPIYRSFRSLFNRSRVLDEGDTDSTDGASEIAKLLCKWPPIKHDPFTFTVDVLMHDDNVTVFKVAGILKLTAETLAEDEHILAFSRTFAVHSYTGQEYKIFNDMLQWDIPTKEYSNNAFRITAIKPRRISLKLESEPDEDLKEKLIEIFMKVTEMNRKICERSLQHENWNLKNALDYFMKLIKLDALATLTKDIKL